VRPGPEFELPNPFSTEFIAPAKVPYLFTTGAARRNPQQVDLHLESLLAKIRETPKGLIVGPHGTGKSTLLHTLLPKLQQSFPRVAFHQLSRDPRRSMMQRMIEDRRARKRMINLTSDLPKGALLVIDGLEQLNRPARWRITRIASAKRATILAWTHRKLTGWNLIHETSTSSKMIQTLATDLMEDSPFELRRRITNELKQRAVTPSTNVRDLWFEMYDRVQEANSLQPTEL